MNNPIIMHVNYCEQGQTIREICRKAVDWGFDGVEFRRRRHNVQESPEEYITALALGVEASGLKQVLFGWPTVDATNPDAAERARQVEEAIGFYRLAKQHLNFTMCNALAGTLISADSSVPNTDYDRHGSVIATDDHYSWTSEAFSILGDAAEELGFRFAFETHMCYLHDLPPSARKLVDLIDRPSVGINLDYGNIVYHKNPMSLKDSVEMISDRLYYVHLKNSVGAGSSGRMPTALCDGEINHREYLRLLKNTGFDGPICIEAPRPGDREWFARQDLAYLKSLIADLEQ